MLPVLILAASAAALLGGCSVWHSVFGGGDAGKTEAPPSAAGAPSDAPPAEPVPSGPPPSSALAAIQALAQADCGCGKCSARGCDACRPLKCANCVARAMVVFDCGCSACTGAGCNACGAACDVCRLHRYPLGGPPDTADAARPDVGTALAALASKDCGCGSCSAKGCEPCRGRNCGHCAAKALVRADCGCGQCAAGGCNVCVPDCDLCKVHLGAAAAQTGPPAPAPQAPQPQDTSPK